MNVKQFIIDIRMKERPEDGRSKFFIETNIPMEKKDVEEELTAVHRELKDSGCCSADAIVRGACRKNGWTWARREKDLDLSL